MRDATNLQWPEGPFGADQRPFGHRCDMLTAATVEWADAPAMALPVAVSTVYLRIRRRGDGREVDEGTLPVGFRVSVIDDPADVPALLAIIDRALTRARRHAPVLAGHALGDDLTRVCAGLPATLASEATGSSPSTDSGSRCACQPASPWFPASVTMWE